MTNSHETLIRQIHGSGCQLTLCLTGGGASAVGDLLAVPGGSQSILEAVVPYSAAALDAFLGGSPEHYCARRTARQMAMAAFQRARKFASREETGLSPRTRSRRGGRAAGGQPETTNQLPRLAGIGCTASLASDRPKRGAHRAHVAVQTLGSTSSVSLELTKDARSRSAEEQIVSALVLDAAAEACKLAERLPFELLPGEEVTCRRTEAPTPWQELLWGNRQTVCQSGSTAPPTALFPGSFHPRHDGHRSMARLATELLGSPVAHEISVANVDKPLLDYLEIAERCSQFGEDEMLWLTRAPTFVEKAELFPGVNFVVGADTIRRIGEPKYYGDDLAVRDAAIARLRELGCKFLVFGRVEAGALQTSDNLALPPSLAKICQWVPAERFRRDVSSTELRNA